jgi:hypothetical protein
MAALYMITTPTRLIAAEITEFILMISGGLYKNPASLA